MKKNYHLFAILLFFLTPAALSSQFCPKNISITNEVYVPPKNWHITYQKREAGNKKLLFFIAVYNYDHQNQENQQRISCLYKAPDNHFFIEMTTDQKNLPLPTHEHTSWKALSDTAEVCFPDHAIDPTSCPWG